MGIDLSPMIVARGVIEKLVLRSWFSNAIIYSPGDEMQVADMADFCLYYILICISYRVLLHHARMQIFNRPL